MGARRNKISPKISPIIAPVNLARGSTKPIKVQKPKQARMPRNNVKTQGRPQQLSPSQSRKLIRLYLLTDLEIGAIREMILCFGKKDIKERAIYTRLRNSLGKNYDHLRPRGVEVMADRVTKLKSCKVSNRSRGSKQTNNDKELPQLITQPFSSERKDAVDGDPVLGVSSISRELHSIDKPYPAAINDTQPLTTHMPSDLEDFLFDFDDDSLQGAHLETIDSDKTYGSVDPRDLILNDCTKNPGRRKNVKATDSPQPGFLDCDYQMQPNSSLFDNWNPLCSLGIRSDLFDELSEPRIVSLNEAQVDTPNKEPTAGTNTAVKFDSTLPMLGKVVEYAVSTDQSTPAEGPSKEKTRSPARQILENGIQTDEHLVLRKSASQRLQDHFSKYPNREKVLLQNILSHCSASTSSIFSTARSSRSSMISSRRAEIPEATAQDLHEEIYKKQDLHKEMYKKQDLHKETYKTQGSHEEIYKTQDLYEETYKTQDLHEETHKTQDLHEETYKTQDLHEETLKTQDLHEGIACISSSYLRMALPGDFITTSLNTFKEHFACPLEGRRNLNPSTCQKCFSGSIPDEDRERLAIPLAVMNYKRILPATIVWTPSSLPWSDKFENTAIHIAAALGADTGTLLRMCRSGIDINRTNTAGQTFMHLIDCKKMMQHDYGTVSHEKRVFNLVRNLKQMSFNFAKVDVFGETFIETVNRRTRHPPGVWQRLLALIDYGQQTDYDVNIRLVRGARGLSREYSEQNLVKSAALHRMKSTSLTRVQNCPRSLDTLVDLPSLSLASLKFYEDMGGKSSLHILADPTTEPEKGNQQQQQNIEVLRPRVLRSEMRFGSDPNHRDKCGETPLMACVREPSEVSPIEELLENGAEIEARNHHGESALHIAVKLGRLRETRILLAHKINVHARNSRRQGALRVGYDAQLTARGDGTLYGKITACLILLMDAGAVLEPSLCAEWSPYHSDHSMSMCSQ